MITCEQPYCERPLDHDGPCGRTQDEDRSRRSIIEERDALRAEVERLTKERDEQLEDSERIIAALVRERDALKSALKTVAVRQREACARAAQAEATGATKCEGGPEFIAAAVRATPLVTEGGK